MNVYLRCPPDIRLYIDRFLFGCPYLINLPPANVLSYIFENIKTKKRLNRSIELHQSIYRTHFPPAFKAIQSLMLIRFHYRAPRFANTWITTGAYFYIHSKYKNGESFWLQIKT